jgi:hypothetical protein
MRRGVIETALTRAGFEFELQRDEDKQPGDEPTLAEVRESGSHATIPFREPLESGRVSSAEPNLGQPPKGRDGLKSLVEAVTEPSVVAELRTARASIEHALFRLGGER